MHWFRAPESKMRALSALGLDPTQAQASRFGIHSSLSSFLDIFSILAATIDVSKALWSVPLRATSGSSEASECVSLLPEFFDCKKAENQGR